MLDVNRLRVIDAVARHGSVTAAAKELHYSQPSVTHHLTRLEAETGAQLLHGSAAGSGSPRPDGCWPTAPPRSSGGSMPPARSCPPRWD
jgi:DNA-binding transcriptional LysR family regulator